MTPDEIAVGARTVVHLAEYLAEWKQSFDELIAEAEPVRRGFTVAFAAALLLSALAADAVVAIRPRLDRSDVAEAIVRGLFHEGKPYDFDFDFTRSDRLVCTEVVYRSYDGIAAVCFPLTARAGRLTLSAEDLVGMSLARTHFEPVAVFSPAHAPGLSLGQAAESILGQTYLEERPS